MKNELVVCAIAKNELPYLLEWIAYYRVLGVDHFYLLDNESTDGSFHLLTALEKAGIVTLIRWPNRLSYTGFEGMPVGPQVPGYNLVLQVLKLGRLAKWVAFLDLDEFVVPVQGDLKNLLRRYEAHAGLALNWRIFGSSGHKELSSDLVIERFQHCSTLMFDPNKHVKCCVQIERIGRANTHVCYPTVGDIVRTNERPIDYNRDGLEDVILDDIAVINHYFVKSYEEWTNKRRRGRVSRPIGEPERFRSDKMFHEYDRNEESDDRIRRFVSATKAEMVVLNELLVSQLGLHK